MAGPNTPTMPQFSYAQAAKGQTQIPTPPSNQSPATTPSLSSEKKQLVTDRKVSSSETNSTAPGQTQPLKGTSQTNDVKRSMSADGKEQPVKGQTVATKAEKDSADQNNTSSKSIVTPKESGVSASHKEEASSEVLESSETIPAATNGSSESWDKQSETSTVVDKAVQNKDNGSVRTGEDDWNAASAIAKTEPEFKAAPIPTVNIWTQRAEQRKADQTRTSTKANVPMQSRVQQPAARPVDSEPPDSTVKRKSSGKPNEKGDVQRKKTDDARSREEGTSKRGTRQNRTNDTDKDQRGLTIVPPPVNDAMSWPTPDTAKSEKKSFAEKGDKVDTKTTGVKSGTKWEKVDFTPTPKFTTPLPNVGARRGGRAPRGGRDGGRESGRGGHLPQASIGEKSEKGKAMGPPPVPKSNEQQRGRNQEASAGDRAVSAPTHGRRSVSVGPSLSGQRKTSGMDRTQLDGRRTTDGQETSELAFTGYGETPGSARSRADSKTFSRQSSSSFRVASYDNGKQSTGAESHAHPRSFSSAERSGDFLSRREKGESHKDGSKQKDFDNKTEPWRDFAGEPKSTRGRGPYRGRGGNQNGGNHSGGNHNGFNGNHPPPTHAFTAPLPQQAFPGSKPQGFGDRGRQQSVPFPGGPPQSGSHRAPPRAQTIATHGIFPGMQGNFGPQVTPIQTDFPMYNGFGPVYPGVISPVPYSNAIEPNALISMVSAQIEYYFSIENLCKDMYLRSNMDSQGFIPLRVITNFNRIKSLTEDSHMIRWVCQMSRNIEFRPVEDGDDRVRKFDKWEQWVLEMDKRQPHARSDGPPPPPPRGPSPPQMPPMYPSMPQMVSPSWGQPPTFEGYVDAPTFTPTNFRVEDHLPPISGPGPMPDIPTEHFSLSNGEVEGSNRSGSVSGEKSKASPSFNPARNASPSAQPTKTLRPSGSSGRSVTPTANGAMPTSPLEVGVENAFGNDRISELHICVRHSPQQPQSATLMSPAVRSASQGSADRQGSVVSPSGASLFNLRGASGSPEFSGKPKDQANDNKSAPQGNDGVFWMKNGATATSWEQEGSTLEKYQSLFERAVFERTPGVISDDLEWLYQFWSHFLIRNFNFDMYTHFHDLAVEDAGAGNDIGMKSLSKYYGTLLTGSQVMNAKIAEDIAKLAGSKCDPQTQIFKKLRAAWRNGAFNFKSRKLIDNVLTTDLKAELESDVIRRQL